MVGKRNFVEWLSPCHGSVKFNVAGYSKGNPGPAECGANVAELLVIKIALEMFVVSDLKGSARLIIESDSLIVVSCCTELEFRPWRLWEIFAQIDGLLLKAGHVSFRKIFSEVNCMADHLAMAGVSRTSM
ncbi:hypothetical protein REPUB_Repub15cG0052600 [Reevesia pubescens]